jgi:hypothetical protein
MSLEVLSAMESLLSCPMQVDSASIQTLASIFIALVCNAWIGDEPATSLRDRTCRRNAWLASSAFAHGTLPGRPCMT